MLQYTLRPTLPAPVTSSTAPRGLLGYSYTRGRARGRALMRTRSYAVKIVSRLKDSDGQLPAEYTFWSDLLAEQAKAAGFPAVAVTAPPSSGKHRWHLATELGQLTAAALGLPYVALWANDSPAGNRRNTVRKLSEGGDYRAILKELPGKVLIVDDFICTGMTSLRCVGAYPQGDFWFSVLGMS